MTRKVAIKPLGKVLQQAGLVSAAQVETALKEQAQSRRLRLGEILALHRWIKIETADFFALKLPMLLKRQRQPIGKYLKQAALLNENQIHCILREQKQTRQKFGEIAVRQGWISPQTCHFFVQFQRSLPKPDLTPEKVIENWRSTAQAESLRAVRDYLLNNQQCNPFWLLERYRRILQQGAIAADGSLEQQELIKSGLVVQQQDKLKVAKAQYVSVFDLGWVEREQQTLQPYRRVELKLGEKVESPDRVLQEIMQWTNHQPWLAQKLCQLVGQSQQLIKVGEEAQYVRQLVHSAVINNWQQGAAAEHLLEIRDRLLNNPVCPPASLLNQYLRIWQQGQLSADGSLEQAELLRLGLVVEQQHTLEVANPIYYAVFNRHWVRREASHLLPEGQVSPSTKASGQQTVTVAAKIAKKKSRKQQRAAWATIFFIGVGVFAAIGWYLRQPRPVVVSTPNSTDDSLSSSPVPNLPPTTPESASRDSSPQVSPPPVPAVPETPNVPNSAPEPIPPARNASLTVPTFTVGTTKAELLQALGEPDWKRQGYWSNSRAWLYRDIVPNQVNLGYLFDTKTQRLRQSEVSFAQTTDLETIQTTLRALLNGYSSASAQVGLQQVYQRQVKQHSFQVGTLEGIIERHDNDEIYIGVWDANFH